MAQGPSRLEPYRKGIFQMLADGHSKADIARALNVPYPTLCSFIAADGTNRVRDGGEPDELRATLERIANAG